MAWSVEVEVVLLRLLPDGQLAHRRTSGDARAGDDLDAAALGLAGVGSDAVLHSTSWRREGGTLVVTYAALPDPDLRAPATPLAQPSVVAGSTALTPTPDVLHAHHVAAHAVRHLADLAERDPVVRAAARLHPDLWAAVAATAARTPTGTHDEAHVLAAAVDATLAEPHLRP